MIILEHNPISSWRNYQRVQFLKGFYTTRLLVDDLLNEFQVTNKIPHESIDNLLEFHLRALKDLSHELFRMPDDKCTDRRIQRIFDKLLGALWHEMGKFRDNIRLLEAYTVNNHYAEDDVIRQISWLDQDVINIARMDLPQQYNNARRITQQLLPSLRRFCPFTPDNRSFYAPSISRSHFDSCSNRRRSNISSEDIPFGLRGYVRLIQS